jgi:hypothetical protein
VWWVLVHHDSPPPRDLYSQPTVHHMADGPTVDDMGQSGWPTHTRHLRGPRRSPIARPSTMTC